MKLSKQDILKLARLSRLKLSSQEVPQYQTELSAILDYVAQLDAVDVKNLAPTYQVTGLTSADPNATRPDELTPQHSPELLLKNVPKVQDQHIQVKRMID